MPITSFLGSDGQVMEQGSFSDLSQHDSYLTRSTPSEARDSASDNEIGAWPRADDTFTTGGKPQIVLSEIESSSVATESRKATNVMVYYMLSIGKLSSLAYVVIAIVYAFAFCFPCEATYLEIVFPLLCNDAEQTCIDIWAESWTETNER